MWGWIISFQILKKCQFGAPICSIDVAAARGNFSVSRIPSPRYCCSVAAVVLVGDVVSRSYDDDVGDVMCRFFADDYRYIYI